MQPIDPKSLSNVRGGAGILGAILGNAGPILNGVASVIGASKAGKGAPPQEAPPPPTAAAAAPGMIPTGDPAVSVSVSINGVPAR